MAYINGNYALLPVEVETERGETVTGETILAVDTPVGGCDMQVKITGNIPRAMTQGESIGTVAQVWDESVNEKTWVNMGEIGSPTVYPNVVPVDNRTDLYVNIPAFYGAAACLLLTDGVTDYALYVCDYNGGEIYFYKDGNKLYLSYDGKTVLEYGIDTDVKIIGVSCNGEGFTDEKLDIYGCTFGVGVTVKRYGRNILDPMRFVSGATVGGITIKYLPDEDCFLLNGTATKTAYTDSFGMSIGMYAKNKRFTLSCKQVSGSINVLPDKYAVFYIGCSNNITGGATNFLSCDLRGKKSGSKICNDNYIYSSWFYISEGNSFDNYKVKIQLECTDNTSPSAYEKFIVPSEFTPESDGTVNGVTSLYPTSTLTVNTGGITIQATPANKRYFKIKRMR